jgi:prepilin-type N-terminal cleavage/methylation domain-containing protein
MSLVRRQIPVQSRGFTLVELSIVMMVLALLLASILTVLANDISQRKLSDTQARLESISSALVAYRKQSNKLPCPSDYTLINTAANFGVQAANPGSCTGGSPAAPRSNGNSVAGAVPTKTLGLPDQMMFDGWGNRFYYAVDKRLTAANAFTTYLPSDAAIGSLTVNDASGSPRTTQAAVVLVSHGQNGHGARLMSGTAKSTSSINTSELENCDCDSSGGVTAFNATFVMKASTVSPTSFYDSYDDLVVYLLRSQMLSAAESQ